MSNPPDPHDRHPHPVSADLPNPPPDPGDVAKDLYESYTIDLTGRDPVVVFGSLSIAEQHAWTTAAKYVIALLAPG